MWFEEKFDEIRDPPSIGLLHLLTEGHNILFYSKYLKALLEHQWVKL